LTPLGLETCVDLDFEFRPDSDELFLLFAQRFGLFGDFGILAGQPYQASNLYVHVWVGSGIADPSGDKFLPEVDTRFPRLTTPHFSGLISTAVLHGDFL
jgi:hypothetical protein